MERNNPFFGTLLVKLNHVLFNPWTEFWWGLCLYHILTPRWLKVYWNTQNKMKFAIILVPQLRTVAICFLWLGFPFHLMRMTHVFVSPKNLCTVNVSREYKGMSWEDYPPWNEQFAPANQWLEDDSFSFGAPAFSGGVCCYFQGGYRKNPSRISHTF